MANGQYGALSIRVTADTRQMTANIARDATRAGAGAAQGIGREVSRGVAGLKGVLGAVGEAAAVGLTAATVAAGGFAVEAFKTAARAGEMDATLRALAQANGLSYDAMQQSVQAIRGQGIEAGVAQNLVAQFARNQLDLGQSTDLARVAQDAAVISGQNSSDTLDQLIHGITTQNSLVLRNAGVNVQAGQAMDTYAASIGKSRAELTPAERAQAVLNAVMEAGTSIAGSYSAAMEEPGKVLRSYPRLFDDIRLSIGRGLVQGFGPLIIKGYELTKTFAGALEPGGKLAPVMDAIGVVATRIAAPIGVVIDKVTAWVKGLDTASVQRFADGLKSWGPLLATAAGGLALVTSPQILSNLPFMGNAVSNIGLAFTKSFIGPMTQGGTATTSLGKAFEFLKSPMGLAIAAFALLMAVSPEFRKAVMDLGSAIMGALVEAFKQIWAAVQPVIPPLIELVRVIGGALAQVLVAVAPLITALVRAAVSLLPAVLPLIPPLIDLTVAVLRPLLPVLVAVAGALSAVLQWLAPLLPVILAVVGAWYAYQAAMAAVQVAQSLVSFAQMIPFLIQYALGIESITIATVAQAIASKIAAAATWLFNAALTAAGGWVGLIIIAVAAFVAGIVLLYQKCEWFRNLVQVVWGAIKVAIDAVVGAVVTLWHWIVGGSPGLIPAFQLLATVFGPVIAAIRLGFQGLIQLAQWVTAGIAAAWNWLSGAVTTAVGFVLSWLRANWPLVLGIIGGPIAMAVVLVIRYWSQIQAGTAAIVNAIRGFLAGAWAAIRNTVTSIMAALTSAVAASWTWLRNTTSAIVNAIRGFLVAAWTAIRNVVTGIANALSRAVAASWQWLSAQVSAIVNGIRGFLSAAWTAIRNIVAQTAQAAARAVAAAWEWTRGATTQIWNAIRGFLAGLWNAIRAIVAAAVTWVQQRIAQGWNIIRAVTAQIWSAVANVIRGTWDGIRGTVQAAVSWVQQRMGQAWEAIRVAASNAWNGILNTIKNVWERLKEAVRAPVAWVVSNVINKLIGGINALVTKIGIPAIPAIPGFAEGGRIPGGWGGGDTRLIMAEPGEWVLTKRQAKAIGYGNLRALPHFAQGGMVGHVRPDAPESLGPQARIPEWIRDVGGAVARVTHIDQLASAGKELFDDVMGMLTYAAAELFKALTAPLRKLAEPYANDPVVFPKQWLGKLMLTVIDKAVEFITSKSMGSCDAGGLVGAMQKYEGHKYIWGGAAAPAGGFDCSSFVNYIAGHYGKLPLPGGFKAPSPSHGPNTTMWLSFGGMDRIPLGGTRPGDVAVNSHHMGFIIGPNGSGFAARGKDSGVGKQSFARGYTYLRWKGGGDATAAGDCGPGGSAGDGPPGNFPSGVRNYAAITGQIARQLGVPQWTNVFLQQMQSESNGNPRAVNNWDSNARRGTPSKGLMQLIDPTFAAYAGPYRNRGIWDPTANIFAAINYAVKRYGSRIPQVLGRGHGYARGGIINEHVVGIGQSSGEIYQIAEAGRPEAVVPLGGRRNVLDAADTFTRGGRGTVINVYPQAGQSEEQIAASVARRMAWAEAGGMI
jgi:SLT domain-containing protein/phage-related protein